MEIRLDSIPLRNEDIISRRTDNDFVLVPSISSMDNMDRIYNLDSLGADIWERIDGINTVGEIIAEVAGHHDGRHEDISETTFDFLYELADANMVRIR